MKVFISGGSKSGKSRYAERLAFKMRKADSPLYYLATMIPADNEDKKRINRHRKERADYGFETVESGLDITAAVEKCNQQGTFLLDSVTALLANAMFLPDGNVDPEAHKKVTFQLIELLSEINNIVIVSDFIYSDAFLYNDLTEAYRRGLAHIDKKVAELSDAVIEVSAGVCIIHKGAGIINEIY